VLVVGVARSWSLSKFENSLDGISKVDDVVFSCVVVDGEQFCCWSCGIHLVLKQAAATRKSLKTIINFKSNCSAAPDSSIPICSQQVAAPLDNLGGLRFTLCLSSDCSRRRCIIHVSLLLICHCNKQFVYFVRMRTQRVDCSPSSSVTETTVIRTVD